MAVTLLCAHISHRLQTCFYIESDTIRRGTEPAESMQCLIASQESVGQKGVWECRVMSLLPSCWMGGNVSLFGQSFAAAAAAAADIKLLNKA